MSFVLKIIIVFILIILSEIYFYKKIVNSCLYIFPRLSVKKFKRIFFWFYIYLNAYVVFLLIRIIYSLISKSGFSQPENIWFNVLIFFPFWINVLVMFQSVLFILIIDLIKFISYSFSKKRKEKLKSIFYKITFAIIVFFALFVPANVLYDYFSVEIREVQYSKENLPEALNNFKITFISDLQADKYTNSWRLQNFIDKVNSTKPDLVLVGGDIITSTPKYINVGAEYLGKIKSKYGVFSCVGDHDNWAYRPDFSRSRKEVINALKKYNVIMVDDGDKVITVDTTKIGITFVTSTYSKRAGNGILDTLAENQKYDFNIFLVHQPRTNLIELAKENNYDLFLAGHTHGGQITFLFPFKNLSPTLFETKYVRGDFYFGNMLMIVTRGLGMSLVPMRYNSTPEVTVINLKRK